MHIFAEAIVLLSARAIQPASQMVLVTTILLLDTVHTFRGPKTIFQILELLMK
jgi:hypothetical protein